ncbi:MAG TPA: FadR/GntR family transcriptional regulator [Streptosporangiaceae bacterium]|jgi:DNA-binding FadR family transcriptional regulator
MTDPASTPSVGGLRSVQHVSPTQQVREQLLAAIERGDFPPGTLLPSERALCATFGVSRVSVREAIAGLDAMGLITVQQGRGAFVREGVAGRYAGPFAKYLQMHRAELVELLKVRGALDELTAEEAALHGSATDLARMTEACQQFQTAVEDDPRDLAKLAELDVAFHMSIAESAGGELLPKLVRELNGLLEESRRITLGLTGQPLRSAQQHQAIADAILSGDGVAARRAANLHVAAVRLWLQRMTAPSGPAAQP